MKVAFQTFIAVFRCFTRIINANWGFASRDRDEQ